MERAPAGQADHARRRALDRRQAAPRLALDGEGGEQAARVGVVRVVEERAPVGVLHRAAGVHHEHVVGDLGDERRGRA